jgi:biopolymer transport protein ExbD
MTAPGPQLASKAMPRLPRREAKLDFPFATINIILLLLFFFIVTGSIVGSNETVVAPPLTERLPPERLPRPLLLVSQAGGLFLDDVAVESSDVIERMGTLPKDSAGRMPVLNIVADRKFSGERFLAIVEEIRSAGIVVRVVTLSSESKTECVD